MNSLERLRSKMAEHDVPAVLISQIDNVGWLTGFTGSFGQAIVTRDGGVFITDGRYTQQAKQQVKGLEVASFAPPTTGAQLLGEQVKALGLEKLHIESTHVTVDQYDRWKSTLNGTQLVAGPDLMTELRLIKTPEEIQNLRDACKLADACFDHAIKFIQPGVTEYDINLEIEFFFRRHGADLGFDPIVVSGVNSAKPHGRAGDKKLEKHDFVTMDFGAKVNGYTSDITRTVVVGEATDRNREIYDLVLKAQLAALDAVKPGVKAHDVDAVPRGIFAEAGMAQYFSHGLGHGLGRNVHDGGRLGMGSETILEPGQVWTIEPGLYIPDYGGVRIEDDVVVTEDGCEILTHSTKEMLVLPR